MQTLWPCGSDTSTCGLAVTPPGAPAVPAHPLPAEGVARRGVRVGPAEADLRRAGALRRDHRLPWRGGAGAKRVLLAARCRGLSGPGRILAGLTVVLPKREERHDRHDRDKQPAAEGKHAAARAAAPRPCGGVAAGLKRGGRAIVVPSRPPGWNSGNPVPAPGPAAPHGSSLTGPRVRVRSSSPGGRARGARRAPRVHAHRCPPARLVLSVRGRPGPRG